MSNLVQRALVGTIFVLIIIGSILFKSWIFNLVMGAVALLGLLEFYGLFKKAAISPQTTLGTIFGLLFYITGIAAIYNFEYFTYFLGVFILTFISLSIAELYRKKKTPFENIAISFVGIFYISLPLILLNHLLDFSRITYTVNNYWPVLTIFILVWCSDTFAYLVGRKLGKHKLFERISPKKSWEGFIGGLLFSILAGYLIAYFTEANITQFVLYGLVASIVGTLGDLVESMLKRSLKIKDSGTIIPGHGGILDRFDAVFFVIPVIYYLHYYIFV